MSYGYDAYDEWLAWARSAQPPPVSAPPTIHPDSAAVRLGLTPEDMEEVLEDQAEWMREEEEEEWRGGGHTTAEENHHHQQVQDNETDARTPPPPLGYTYGTTYDTAHDDDVHVVLFEHRDEPDDGAVRAEPDHDVTEPLARELAFPGDSERDWAEEMEEEIGFSIQGEYIHSNYPPAPSPAPWHPPHPPTSDYTRPRTRYTPKHAWYNPPRAPRTSRRPPFRPYARPQRARRAPRENRTGHVTATRTDRFRATTRATHIGPPLYVPPALRGSSRTSHRSQQSNPRHSGDWRDPPPHKKFQNASKKRSDSPNWRAPSPNRPTSFRNPPASPQPPASPANSPPASPTRSLRPEIPPTVQQHHFESQLGSELIALVKTTSEALRSIAQVAEGLIRRVNAERRLAHKLQRMTWSSREDTRGNAVCLQPPAFPPVRGAPVTGSLPGSDLIA